MKITQMIKKSLRKRIVSVVLVICMMCGLMLPLASVTASAEAPATYSTITAGSTASVSISTANDAKYFKFVPTKSGTYKFYSSDNTADTYGALLNADGDSLISNDDGANNNNNFMFTYECTANTTYYVKAYFWSSNTGSYTLHVEEDFFAGASTITAGSTASVSISTANDAKYFKFVPTQTGEYKFWSSNNTADTYGALLNADGASLISDDDGAGDRNFMFTYNCTANTTYYIKAYMYSSNTGSYTLHVAKVGADPGVVPGGDMVDINATGTHSLFNSGATGQGYKYSSTQGSDANPNSHSYSNSGYDIYGQMNQNSTLTIGMGCSFTIHKEVTERATLTVYAYDVDEESGETDTVYLVDETDGTRTPVGTLKGMNDQWNTTVLYIDSYNFVQDHTYRFEVTISDTAGGGAVWWVYLRTVSLDLTVGEYVPVADILDHSFSASISDSGTVSTNLYLETDGNYQYTLEYAASINGTQRGSSLNQSIAATSNGVSKSVSFSLESGAPSGVYQIDVIVKDSRGNTVTTYSTWAGYRCSAVTYDANGGSNNLPIDTNAYYSGSTVTVRFDYVPSRYDYVFRGWSTDKNALHPTYKENGVKTFTMGEDDVTLYAVWRPAICTHEYILQSVEDPTCCRNGTETYVCSFCDDVMTQSIPMIDHHFVTGDIVSYPTCTEVGYRQPDYCNLPDCELVYPAVLITIPALGHSFSEVSRVEATCEVDGVINYACYCDATKYEIIKAYGHSLATRVDAEATCTTDGLIVDYCTNDGCDYEKHTVTHGSHNYVVTDRVEPACETEGYVEYSCTNCPSVNYEMLEAGRHNYVETSRVEAQIEVEGSITYTCSACDDSYTVVIPALLPVLKNSAVLLIQNSLPWAEDVNTTLLEVLKDRGVVSYYNIINTNALSTIDLTQYGVVFIANDQSTSMYNGLSANATKLENYVRAGGNLIYGACDEGWGGCGHLTHALPGGVTTSNYYSVHNYIVDELHPIVTGVYTDNRSLKDELLKGNYCSHTYFDSSSLPAGANVILRDANGNPTLVEYNLGNGTVMASGLTWEYFYVRNHYDMLTNYSKYAYDDLVTYMVYISNTCDHDYEIVETVDPTCEGNGYTSYVCTLCGHEYKGNIVDALGHDFVEVSRENATCTEDGMINYACSCGEKKVSVVAATGHSIETVIGSLPTCTTDGRIVDYCTNSGCDYEKITLIHGSHDHQITDRQESACETEGYVEYTCVNCGDVYREILEAGKHSYVETSRVDAKVGVEGSITFTCSACSDSYTISIPALLPVLKNSAVLLIQNSLPWAEDVNTTLLEVLKDRGVVSYYNIINTSALATIDLTQYGVVFIANDQSTSMYNGLSANATKLENYVRAGGNLIYGACDEGWGGSGSLTHALPGGVTTSNYYSVHNYIVDMSHPIVTGQYTDNQSLRDELLKGNYCSHTYFTNSTLPADTKVILRDANGNPTLVEYNLGDGTVIASGLTWEYFYVRNHYDMVTNYSKYAYDDLVTYMVYMSNTCTHEYEMIEIVEPTCIYQGYTRFVCTLCGHQYSTDYTPATGHTFVETSRVDETCTTDGTIYYTCHCGDTKTGVIPAHGHDIQSIVEIEVSCTTDGLIVDYCVNAGCNYEKETVIHGEHNYEISDREDPACEEEGYVEYSCVNCGDVYCETLEAGMHDYVETSRVEAQVGVEGSVTYTCTKCHDSYTIVLPELLPVLKTSAVLLIQNSRPWAEDVNASLLEALVDRGVVSYYNIINTNALATIDLTQYGVVFIANDQTTAMYNDLASNATKLENYVRAGGNLIYGACDEGWGGCGHLTHALPGGVQSSNYYSVHNYIVDELHPIVTGVYTDNRSLKDELLKGNYCSHTYFNNSSLPEGANVILRDANGNPTLVEYNLGDGTVMASGLTWEYFYVRNHYDMLTNYSKYAYDDLVTYMVYKSSTCVHDYEMVENIAPTCEENGYTSYVCTLCGHEYKGNVVNALGHDFEEISRDEGNCLVRGTVYYECHCGETKSEKIGYGDHICGSYWIIDVAPTATTTGLKHKECRLCYEPLVTEIIPILATIVIDRVEVEAGNTVRVSIDVRNNPGIIGAVLSIDFDSELTLVGYEVGRAWNTLDFTRPSEFSNPCNFAWDGLYDADYSDGTIITLIFEVPEDAEAGTVYDINASYTYGNIVNADLALVDVEIENGAVIVADAMEGDVNGNGILDVADVIMLRRYLTEGYDETIDISSADMDNDGYLTIADVILLRRLLVEG